MPVYYCGRCGHFANQLGDMKKHLTKKKACSPLYADVDRSVLLDALRTAGGKNACKTLPTASDVVVPFEEVKDVAEFVKNVQHDVIRLQKANADLTAKLQAKPAVETSHVAVPTEAAVDDGECDGVVCGKCDAEFDTADELETHMRTKCEMAAHFDNVYSYDEGTFGCNLYGSDGAGDIYIVQTDFTPGEAIYKVGKTTNIRRRMVQYRTGAVREPRLYCYYPFRNMSKADADLKSLLAGFQLKRELYVCDLDELQAVIRGYQLRTDRCLAEFTPRLAGC